MAGIVKCRRQLFVSGTINIASISDLIGQIQNFTQKDKSIELLITSTGGDSDAGFAAADMMEALKASGVTIRTIGLGNIDSIAVLLLASGSMGKRYMLKSARVMIHETAQSYDKVAKCTTEWEDSVRDIRRYQNRYWSILQRSSDIKKHVWTLKSLQDTFERKGDTYLTAQDMENYGWVDYVADTMPTALTPPFE